MIGKGSNIIVIYIIMVNSYFISFLQVNHSMFVFKYSLFLKKIVVVLVFIDFYLLK